MCVVCYEANEDIRPFFSDDEVTQMCDVHFDTIILNTAQL